MPEAKIFLPWPDKVLSPNARKHWTVVAKAKKKAKNDTYYAVLEQGIGKIDADRITVRVSFYPPNRHHYDTDGLVSRMKAGFDAISLAIGIDDSKWNLELAPRGPIEKNGMVKIELEW